MPERLTASESDALIVIDVQNDFCPGGALAVPEGDAILPVVGALMRRFPHVILTQDWHPSGHASFASSHQGKRPFETIQLPYGPQTLWPDHCLQGSQGAEFHKELNAIRAELVIRKGFRPGIDSYSAFFENDRKTPTGLAGYLRERGLRELYFVGLATDYCVAFSAIDARRAGFGATVIENGCRAIDLAGSLAAARDNMRKSGVKLVAEI
jgi:nicotinamidase/pyrazinamidase